MKRRFLVLLTILVCVSGFAAAADKDVGAVAKAIERDYGLKHKNLPWIARATMKPFLWGSGVSMSFALFEDQPLPRSVSLQQLDELTAKALGPGWNQFITRESFRKGEKTLIYAKFERKHMLMLIVDAERDETTVLKMKLNASQALKNLQEPKRIVKGKTSDKDKTS